MFRISFIDNETSLIFHIGGFKQISEAMNWLNENKSKITPLKLLVWNDYLDCFVTLQEL